MICVSPVSIQDPRQSLGSIRLTVPCGKCGSCRHNRRVEWSFRLKEEYNHSTAAQFLTLTYTDDQLIWADSGPTLYKKHLQDWFKRLRKNTGQKCRYYAVGEYGTTTQRPHYHVILFNLQPKYLATAIEAWHHGHLHVGEVNEATIHYTTKYHVNYDKTVEGRAPEFAVMSRKPGIGAQYVPRARKWHEDNGNLYVINNGYSQRMPRYYKEKIFSADQRAILSEAMAADMQLAYWKEYARLERLGHADPDAVIESRRYLDSLRVYKKAQEADKI